MYDGVKTGEMRIPYQLIVLKWRLFLLYPRSDTSVWEFVEIMFEGCCLPHTQSQEHPTMSCPLLATLMSTIRITRHISFSYSSGTKIYHGRSMAKSENLVMNPTKRCLKTIRLNQLFQSTRCIEYSPSPP